MRLIRTFVEKLTGTRARYADSDFCSDQSNKKLTSENALRDIYKVLAIYAFLIWSPNVLAVFFPAERTTIPNLGDLAASIQWGRRNGLDLKFLD